MPCRTEQTQKYLAQLQAKQTNLQQELEQALNLNQLHIQLNQSPEQILLTLNELRQTTQTAINSFDSENVRLAKRLNNTISSFNLFSIMKVCLIQHSNGNNKFNILLSVYLKPNSMHGSSRVAKRLSRLGLFLMHALSSEQQEQLSHRFEQQQQELKMLTANFEQMTKQIDEVNQNLKEITLKGQQNNEKRYRSFSK